MKWRDLEKGNVPKDFLCQFIASLPKDLLIFLIKSNPSLQKEFAGFRLEHLSKERLASKFAPYFYKDEHLRKILLVEWTYHQEELLSNIEHLSGTRLDKELPSLAKKYGFISVYLALLFDVRKGTDKLIYHLEQEAYQKKLWEREPKSEAFSTAEEKFRQEALKRIAELEEQRERLYMGIERERDSRAKLEDLHFSLKKENKDQKKRLEELEAQYHKLNRRFEFIQGQESKTAESLCYSRKLSCYQLPFVKEKIFEDVLKALCFIAGLKSATSKG